MEVISSGKVETADWEATNHPPNPTASNVDDSVLRFSRAIENVFTHERTIFIFLKHRITATQVPPQANSVTLALQELGGWELLNALRRDAPGTLHFSTQTNGERTLLALTLSRSCLRQLLFLNNLEKSLWSCTGSEQRDSIQIACPLKTGIHKQFHYSAMHPWSTPAHFEDLSGMYKH